MVSNRVNGANGAHINGHGHSKYPASYFDIPKECKAGVMIDEGPNFRVEVQMVPVPEPGPDDVLLRLNATGICYSDIHYMLHDIANPKMSEAGIRSPGHEGAGVVVKLGSNVKNWKIGDRAGVKPVWNTCGSCQLCWGTLEAHCPKKLFTGMQVPGTYQQYIVSPARYTSPIPDGVDDFTAAPIMCSATTIYRSLIESQLKPGDWAVFPGGGGGVGIQGVQLAKAMGFRPVVVDTADERRKLAFDMGAEHFVDFKTTPDVAKEVIQYTDGVGAHAVFVTAPGAYNTAISLCGSRVGSKVMCIGLPALGTTTIGMDPAMFIHLNFTIKGTLVGNLLDTQKVLEFAKRGLLRQICTVYSIDQLPEAVEKVRRGQMAGRAVVDFNT